ncbi:MAG: ABC transporter permease [Halobacteriota archaeon]
MSNRPPPTDRGRIRVTGFDAEAIDERGDLFDWTPAHVESVTGRRERAWSRFKRNRTAVVGLSVIAFLALVAAFARPIVVAGVPVQPLSLTPYDPAAPDFAALDQPPSTVHPFGTDWAGRDVLSRVMVAGRYSLSIGVIAVGLTVLIGVPLGAVAGYFGGWVDELVMRVVDLLYAFPFLVLAIALIAALGQGFWKLILALAIVGWIGYARLIRGEILRVKENEYVTAAKALGATDRAIIFRHIVPNAIAPVVVQATLGIGTVVLSAAALGFLGVGLEPGTAEWGSMLSSGRDSLLQGQWWISVFPGLAIFAFVLSINLVGDGVRDALDPQGDTGGDRNGRR